MASALAQLSGTATTSVSTIQVAEQHFEDMLLECSVDQAITLRLEFSLDGANWTRLRPGDSIVIPVRGVAEILLRSTAGSTAWTAILTRSI